ncbi:hypothetical protein SUGI_0176000 [Cryptomeria japonica]|uniref:probable calcium-binding protein CML25 n=1 Tax=Cryptomeria japonica TaxID=3369 RepID=UPI002408D137|nr:probable calcium-binding protein CML25 [Cryptomeria japonica]GLJ11744.1 hypothetical protein SUGI_0176000 [Cryptomeria japonica]
MGLPRFLKQRLSRSEPPSPLSLSRSGSQSSSLSSQERKKFFAPRRLSSTAKDIPSLGNPESSSSSVLRRTRSNPGSPSRASDELVKDLEKVFKKFDRNGDGKISWVDLGSIMGALGYKASEEELQKMIREADCDGDGFIDLHEFIELNTRGVDPAGNLKDLKDAFQIFDLDGNGAISTEELHKVLRNLGEDSTMEDCELMIRGADCDGNGSIDFEEFKIMMSSSV